MQQTVKTEDENSGPHKKVKGCDKRTCTKRNEEGSHQKITLQSTLKNNGGTPSIISTQSSVKNADGTVTLQNPNIALMDQDILYHLGLDSGSHNLVKMFGDVNFVVMGGTPSRMKAFANFIIQEIEYELPVGSQLDDISAAGHRYSMYKIGPVISVSHGMGTPSVSILLNELIKLMYHAKVKRPVFFRIGTSGGIGVKPGTIVVSNGTLNGMLEDSYNLPVLGKMIKRPTTLDQDLVEELLTLSEPDDDFQIVSGKTLSCDDFYEGEARRDGAFCDFTELERLEFLKTLQKHGVVNIEMESTIIAALTHQAGIKSAIICVTLLDRLFGDQIDASAETLSKWQERPQIIVARYIKKHLGIKKS